MDRLIVILGWGAMALGTLFFLWSAGVSLFVPGEGSTWGEWIAGSLVCAAFFFSGWFLLRRKTAGRYLFSVCLALGILMDVGILKFFSEPIVLDGSLQPVPGSTDISWGERGRLLMESFSDNAVTLLLALASLAVCLGLLILIHSPRFKKSFRKQDPSQ